MVHTKFTTIRITVNLTEILALSIRSPGQPPALGLGWPYTLLPSQARESDAAFLHFHLAER